MQYSASRYYRRRQAVSQLQSIPFTVFVLYKRLDLSRIFTVFVINAFPVKKCQTNLNRWISLGYHVKLTAIFMNQTVSGIANSPWSRKRVSAHAKGTCVTMPLTPNRPSRCIHRAAHAQCDQQSAIVVVCIPHVPCTLAVAARCCQRCLYRTRWRVVCRGEIF